MKKVYIAISCIFLIIIIYLFSSLEQTEISCKKSVNYLDKYRVVESVNANTSGSKIKELSITKTIILDEENKDNVSLINYIKNTIDAAYSYLGEDKYDIEALDDRVVVKINVKNNETVILNNISFVNDSTIKINTNTKSSEVIALRVGDNYTEGELMKHLKNNGFSCK